MILGVQFCRESYLLTSYEDHHISLLKMKLTIFVGLALAVMAPAVTAISCSGECGPYPSTWQVWACDSVCSGCVCRCGEGDKYALC